MRIPVPFALRHMQTRDLVKQHQNQGCVRLGSIYKSEAPCVFNERNVKSATKRSVRGEFLFSERGGCTF